MTISVSSPISKTHAAPYLLAIAGLIVALALGIAIGWQIGEHRAGGRPEATPSAPIAVPEIKGPAADIASASTDAAASTRSAAALDTSKPASIITVYLVATPADAGSLQDLLDQASRLGDQSGSSAWVLVAGTQSEALDAGAAIDTAKARYGADRVEVLDMRSPVTAR